MGTLLDLSVFIGKSVATGVIGKAGGKGLEWVMGLLGYEDSTEKKIDDIQNKLKTISDRFSTVQTELGQIEKLQQDTIAKIDDLTKRIEAKIGAMYKGLAIEMKVMQLKSSSTTWVTATLESREIILTIFNRLYDFTTMDPVKSKGKLRKDILRLVDDILSATKGIEPQLMVLHESIVNKLDNGLLDCWNNLIALGAQDSTQLLELFDILMNRFKYILTIELLGIYLMLDAYHMDGQTDLIRQFWSKWKRNLKEQLNIFLAQAEKITASRIDDLTKNEFFNLAANDTDSVLRKADRYYQEMLGILEAADEAPNLLTLRLLNCPETTKQLFPENLALRLVDLNDNKKVFTGVPVAIYNGVTYEDWAGNNGRYSMARFTFNVPTGTYRIHSETPHVLSPNDMAGTIEWTNPKNGKSLGLICFYLPQSPLHPIKEFTLCGSNIVRGITLDCQENIYMNSAYSEICKYDNSGKLLTKIDTFKGRAYNMKISSENIMYVTSPFIVDQNQNKVATFNVDGQNHALYNYQGTEFANFGPFAIGKEKQVYVYGFGKKKESLSPEVAPALYKYDVTGKLLLKVEFPLPGVMNQIDALALDNKGFLYALDASDGKMAKFNNELKCIGSWDCKRTITSSLIEIDKQGFIYELVFGMEGRFIIVTDLNGNFICKIEVGSFGDGSSIEIGKLSSNLYLFDTSEGSHQCQVKVFSLYPSKLLQTEW